MIILDSAVERPVADLATHPQGEAGGPLYLLKHQHLGSASKRSTAESRIIPARQQGIATLATALLLLFILTMTSLLTARVSITEQRLSRGEYQTLQAYEAAQAGLAAGLSDINAQLQNDPDGSSIRLSGPRGILGNGTRYQVSYLRGDRQTPPRLLTIISRGHSSDASANKTLHQAIDFRKFIATRPRAALTGRSAPSLRQVVLSNPDTGLLILSGKKTHQITGVNCQSGSCQIDPRLQSISTQGFMRRFFDLPTAELRHASRRIDCHLCRLDVDSRDQRPLWINASQRQAIRIDSSRLGTTERPVIVIVNGNLTQLSGTQIHGLLYVKGDIISHHNNFELEGALIATGRIDISGPALIHYSSTVMSRLDHMGYYDKLPGGWRDF